MKLEVFESTLYKAIGFLIDFIFVIDILVNFNMTIEQSEKVVYERKLIAQKYLGGRFVIDFLSAVPLDGIAKILTSGRLQGDNLRLFSLLKLIRMLRLSRMLRALNVNRALKVQIKIMKLIFQLVLLCHCQACLFIYVVDLDGLWYHPVYMNLINWSSKMNSSDAFYKYIVCLYFSLLQIFGRNTFPFTNMSIVISSINILIGLLVQGNMLGLFAEVLFEIQEKELMAEHEADASVSALKHVAVGPET